MKFVSAAGVCLLVVAVSACNVSKSDSPSSPLAPAAVPTTDTGAPANTAARLTGPEVIAIVAAKYPERLVGGISHEERVRNMEFLRDRIIEVGTCGGMLLARNTKANGHLSIDAINWRHGAEDTNDVVDIAYAYDDASRRLDLHWMVTAGPAGWTPIDVRCS